MAGGSRSNTPCSRASPATAASTCRRRGRRSTRTLEGPGRGGRRASFAGFDHPATAPLIQLGPNLWLQELFHGPTLAFKDFALQMVARLLDAALRKRGRTATILAATSGGCPCSCQ